MKSLVKNKFPAKYIILILLIFFVFDPALAETYRWVDERGVMHFSDKQPPKSLVKKIEEGKTAKITEKKGNSKRQPQAKKVSKAEKKLYDFRGRVVRVLGLDSIQLDSGKVVKYIGLKDPQTYLKSIGRGGDAAKARGFHSQLVKGKTVTVLLGNKHRDKKGRYLGHVFLGQEAFINAELIRNGYALTEEYPSDFEYQPLFNRLQKDAQKRGVGMWRF